MQAAYEVEIDGDALGRVDSDESVLVPSPGTELGSRHQSTVRVRVWSTDGSASSWSEPLEIEAGLLVADDWSASWVATADPDDLRPQHLRRVLRPAAPVERARLYVTSAGINDLWLNGRRVGDHVLAR